MSVMRKIPAGAVHQCLAARSRHQGGLRAPRRPPVHAGRDDRRCAEGGARAAEGRASTRSSRVSVRTSPASRKRRRSRSTTSRSSTKSRRAGLDAHISVKPTQLGLDQDPAVCRRNLERILERTEQRNNFLWIDMESSPYVDPTLDVYRHGRSKSAKIGLAVQAYLYRTMKDIESLIPLGCAIRVVKGGVPRAARGGCTRRSRMSTRTSSSSASGCCSPMRSRPAACCTSPRTTWRSSSGCARGSAATTSRRPRTSSRCCTGSSAGSSSGSPGRSSACASSSAMARYWFPWDMRRLAERPANVWFVVKSSFG